MASRIVPYYIKTRLVEVPGSVGLYLAAVVCATTSTTSSTINSQAAILYVDIISPRWKYATRHVLWITGCTALALGVTMTAYSMLCIYMGPLNRMFLTVNTGLTSPYVGLCLLAILFPFVHSKGAGVATIVVVIVQIWHGAKSIQRSTRPPRMPISLECCPGNITFHTSRSTILNISSSFDVPRSDDLFYFFRMSYFWTSFFGIFATVAIGVLVSALTGEIWSKNEQPELCSDFLVRIWRKQTHLKDESPLEDMKTSNLDKHKCNAEVEDLLMATEESHA
ncbi:sodium-coupled monocarboxylate transporter 2-like isoform X2 [Dermacentor variabilis]|uniref:sodium-coupled monocarboxylate transporter 2-like isoform X2 n=1 Tax=Dermacentor variabilis TaxID=34621 RepID=UPI003F5C3433